MQVFRAFREYEGTKCLLGACSRIGTMGTHTEDDSPSSVKKNALRAYGLQGAKGATGECPQGRQMSEDTTKNRHTQVLCRFFALIMHFCLIIETTNSIMHFCPILGTTNSIMHFCLILGTSPHAQPPLRSLASPKSHHAGESKRHQHQRQHRIADGGTRVCFSAVLVVPPFISSTWSARSLCRCKTTGGGRHCPHFRCADRSNLGRIPAAGFLHRRSGLPLLCILGG